MRADDPQGFLASYDFRLCLVWHKSDAAVEAKDQLMFLIKKGYLKSAHFFQHMIGFRTNSTTIRRVISRERHTLLRLDDDPLDMIVIIVLAVLVWHDVSSRAHTRRL